MKTSSTFALILFFTCLGFTAHSQSLQASTYFERTVVGPKVGTAIGVEFADQIEVGGFYQKAVNAENGAENYGRFFEKEFFGAYLSYPVLNEFNTTVKLNVRTGVSNGENFLITPSLLANYHLSKKISIGGGLGVRMFRPTYQASFKFSL